MALARFNFVAMACTRRLTQSVGYNLFPFNFIIFMIKSRGFLLGLKIISFVSETFSEILLALSQFVRFLVNI